MSLPGGSGLNVSVAVTPSAPGESSGGAASLTLSAEERRLFCTHSVASLKQLAEDKRNASDDKKEELRQLVGSVKTHSHTKRTSRSRSRSLRLLTLDLCALCSGLKLQHSLSRAD